MNFIRRALLAGLMLVGGQAFAVDFTLTSPAATNNPWAPSNVIVPVSTIRSDASPDSFRAGVTGVYAVAAHDANYGAVITATITVYSGAAIHVSDNVAVGAVVRTGGNAGAGILAVCTSSAIQLATVTAAGTPTSISTSAAWPTTPAASDVISVTISISAGTATITASQNGSNVTFSGNTTTTYTGEASLAAGFSFNPQNNNTTRLAQFTGTGVTAGGGTVINPIMGGGGGAARPITSLRVTPSELLANLSELRKPALIAAWKFNDDQFKLRAVR